MKSFILLLCFTAAAKDPIPLQRLNQLSGERGDKQIETSAWNKRYSKKSYVYGKSPAKFLAENFNYLKPRSTILDVGMGEGRNAVFLAQKGHSVIGVDISTVATNKAKKLAKDLGVKIKAVTSSMEDYKVADGSLDAIICFYYVDRELIPKMKQWLRPGGLIIFEANDIKERKRKGHKRNPESYYLKENELLSLFPGLKVLKYESPLHEEEFRSSIIVKKDE